MMFEGLMRRAADKAEGRARERAGTLAEQIQDELPGGIAAELVEDGVSLAGRDIARRFALEPKLRWLVAELMK